MSETSNLYLDPLDPSENIDTFDIEFPSFPTQITWNTVNDSMEWVQSNIAIDINLFRLPTYQSIYENIDNNDNVNININSNDTNHIQDDLNTTLVWLRSNMARGMNEPSTGLDYLRNSPINCPLCSNELLFRDYFTHLSDEHPLTYQIWLYFTTPSYITYDVDQMSYDELLELCNTVGYHNVGLTEEQKEAATEPIDTIPSSSICCTICLSTFPAEQELDSEKEKELVKIRSCSHTFCKECIYEWLSNHKTCPVCIQKVLPELES